MSWENTLCPGCRNKALGAYRVGGVWYCGFHIPDPNGPTREGSTRCQSGSLASGGTKTHCSCDICF